LFGILFLCRHATDALNEEAGPLGSQSHDALRVLSERVVKRFERAVGLVLLLFMPLTVTAQGTHLRKRPKVGLALGGGGALGLAHIGVLRYFEEHHIPVDAVAGTSMGGLVGGLYATGLRPNELHDVVREADWDTLLNPVPRFEDQPIVEKQGWNRTFGNLTLRLGKRFSLPEGLNPGEALALMFSRYTAAYGEISSFDELPTPFRCVATDLVSGDAVVLGKGSLSKALRATMAIPGVFTPVPWDDKLLVDGGIVQNLPVEVVRSMGAEQTIAVKLLGLHPTARQLRSLTSIIQRTVAVSVEQNERRSEKLADVVIVVDTKQLAGTDYEQYQKIIQAGYEAAKSKSEELKQFELSPEEWENWNLARERATRRREHSGRIVEVAAADQSFQRNAEAELQRKLGTGVVSEQRLTDTLSGIVTATGVPSASYQWSEKGNGYRVEFLPRGGDKIFVRPSFRVGISSGEPSRTQLNLAVSSISSNAYKSRTLASISIGYDPGIRTEYYHPFDGSGYFVAPGMEIERKHVNTYEGASRISETRDRFALHAYAGIGTWRYWQLRAGVQSGYDSYSKPIEVDGVVARSHGFANPEVVWVYHTLDSGGLPERGTRIDGAAGYSFRNGSFPYARSEFSQFRLVHPKLTLFGTGEFGTSFGRKLNYFEQYTAGGSGQLSSFRYQEFHSNTMFLLGGGVIIHTPPVRVLSVYPGLALWYEAGRFDQGSAGWSTHQSTNAGVFFPTRIGAAGVGVSFDEAGRARFRLMLGTLGK
jgi:NTE family protein